MVGAVVAGEGRVAHQVHEDLDRPPLLAGGGAPSGRVELEPGPLLHLRSGQPSGLGEGDTHVEGGDAGRVATGEGADVSHDARDAGAALSRLAELGRHRGVVVERHQRQLEVAEQVREGVVDLVCEPRREGAQRRHPLARPPP